jgi:hypothetical protein
MSPDFTRESVTGEIEEATGAALSANDPLPDSLIANAQALGLSPGALRLFIFDEPARDDWSLSSMAHWAATYRLRNGTNGRAEAPGYFE